MKRTFLFSLLSLTLSQLAKSNKGKATVRPFKLLRLIFKLRNQRDLCLISQKTRLLSYQLQTPF